MTNTTYYNLNIVEGTDIVNPLIVDNPNYEKIDEVMHNNAVSGVTLATEIANATVHAITRENSECSVIRFIATSEWKAGDTVTVDGVPVTALLPSGETLPDGAYVINANVLCILTGTNLTVYAERTKTDNANEIKYKDTNVEAALDILNSNLKYKLLGTFTGLSLSNLRNEDWYDIYLEISVRGWDFYNLHLPGLKQIQTISKEKLYSSEDDNSYIKYSFNMWNVENQLQITGKFEGVDITGNDVSIKVWYK